MSAVIASRAAVVTPASVRRRIRERRLRALRAPIARPQGLAAPVGRPQQPVSPGAGAPVRLRRVEAGKASATAAQPVQLTDRGIAVVVCLLAIITVATVGIAVVKFLGVSNAPLDQEPTHSTMVVGQVRQQ